MSLLHSPGMRCRRSEMATPSDVIARRIRAMHAQNLSPSLTRLSRLATMLANGDRMSTSTPAYRTVSSMPIDVIASPATMRTIPRTIPARRVRAVALFSVIGPPPPRGGLSSP